MVVLSEAIICVLQSNHGETLDDLALMGQLLVE